MSDEEFNELLYAVVDIESSGGDPRKDRITEIAIFIHNGHRVIEEYCTLVNPETYIPPFITMLTGISNEMVAEAPTWNEIADKVDEMTRGRVFVAHNVRFDYSFIANEFRRLGRRWQRRNLCTVRLSRTILPGLEKYSLGKLCEEVGIPLNNRHRAFGDGAATAELFHLLLRKDKQSVIRKALADEISNSLLPANMSREAVLDLPEECGVYYFRDEKGRILYIGKSTNIRQRVISHFSGDMNRKQYFSLKQRMHSIDYEVTGSELVALLLESHEIKRWMPDYNVSQRRRRYRYGIYRGEDPNGYTVLRVGILNTNEEPLMKMSSRQGALYTLKGLVEKNSLCAARCESFPLEEPCNCLVCAAQAQPEEYNRRVNEAINRMGFPHPDFVVLAEGRKPQEKAIISVRQGKFSGIGFLDAQVCDLSGNFESLCESVTPYPDHPDQQKIIKNYISRNKKQVRVIYPVDHGAVA